MLSKDILEKLVCFTDEEINHLNGVGTIDRSIFVNEKSHIIDYHHLLGEQQFFSVRKHTCFCNYPNHKHNYIELMYVYGGTMTHHIDNKTITIHEGELLLLNQNIEHSIDYCGENDIIFNFIIRPEFLQFLSTMLEEDNDVSRFIYDSLYSNDNDGEFVVFKVSDNNKVKMYIEAIITNLYEAQLNQNLELKLLVGLLLTELMNNPECIESYTGRGYEKILVSMILKYIGLHYRDGTLAELSTKINQPDYKICKLIKKQTGHTFVQLLQEEKLKVATRLLVTTNLSMNDLIVEVGYENVSYFYRIFKKKYHATPLEYRLNQSINASTI